jgi:hypothetical protein
VWGPLAVGTDLGRSAHTNLKPQAASTFRHIIEADICREMRLQCMDREAVLWWCRQARNRTVAPTGLRRRSCFGLPRGPCHWRLFSQNACVLSFSWLGGHHTQVFTTAHNRPTQSAAMTGLAAPAAGASLPRNRTSCENLP